MIADIDKEGTGMYLLFTVQHYDIAFFKHLLVTQAASQ